MGMFTFITKPINFILDIVEFLGCLIAYIGNVFKWTGIAFTECIKVILAMPFCFFFYLFHGFWNFVLFMIFDVLIVVVLMPSRWLGNALGYPLTMPFNKDKIKEFKSYFMTRNIYDYLMPTVVSRCYSFDKLAPFPKWNLKVPKYGK
jgi:hypothetical protein